MSDISETEAEEQLKAIAEALGLVVDVHYADFQPRYSYVKLLNKTSGYSACWIKDDNSHATTFGMKYINDLPDYHKLLNSLTSNQLSFCICRSMTTDEIMSFVEDINTDVCTRALKFILAGNFRLKVSKARTVHIQPTSSSDELILRLSVAGVI